MKLGKTAAVIAAMLILGGCSNGKADMSKVNDSMVGINSDGSVNEVSVESMDASYYTQEELKDYVDQQVAHFNEQYPQETETDTNTAPDAVRVVSLTVNDDQARLELYYNSVDLYNEINEMNLQVIPMDTAASIASITNRNDLLDAKTNEKVTFADCIGNNTGYVVVTEAAGAFRTAGKITLYSENVELVDAYTVRTGEEKSVFVFK